MMHRKILLVALALFFFSASSALPTQEQNPSQNSQPQQVLLEKSGENAAQVKNVPVDQEVAPGTQVVPEGEPVVQEKSDLDTANTFWGGYYASPYYGGWGGYSGWRRGYGGWGYGGYGYGRGLGYGGWGWGGGWGRRYYWR